MHDRQQPIQASHLRQLRHERTDLVLFLVNGLRIRGVLTRFDDHSLLISNGRSAQLIYKHAVSSIVPAQPDPRAPSPPFTRERW